MCFPLNFAKFLRMSCLTEHLWWLLLKWMEIDQVMTTNLTLTLSIRWNVSRENDGTAIQVLTLLNAWTVLERKNTLSKMGYSERHCKGTFIFNVVKERYCDCHIFKLLLGIYLFSRTFEDLSGSFSKYLTVMQLKRKKSEINKPYLCYGVIKTQISITVNRASHSRNWC